MSEATHKPRVALLGAREDEIELLAELHRQDRVGLVAVYDPDPHATGLALAQIVGVASGSDAAARETFAEADFVVLPSNRLAYAEAIEWCSGLRAELVGVEEARRRWGSSTTPPGGTPEAHTRLRELESASARLGSSEELAEWFLDTAMHAVGATGGSLQILAPDTSELYLLAARGLSEQVVHTSRHPLGEPISGLTAAMQTTQVLHGERAGRIPTQRGRVSSALSVPLVADDDVVIGVLNVSSTVEGRRFDEEDAERLRQLGPSAAHLLRRAHAFESRLHRRNDVRILETLRELEQRGADFSTSLQMLSQKLCTVFDAESVVLHLSTSDGDWMELATAERSGGGGRMTSSRTAAARAFAQRQWLHLVDAPTVQAETDATETDEITAMVERALEPVPDSAATYSSVYAPLVGTSPVGVLAASFRRLSAAERFRQHGEPTLRQVALYVETRVREQRLEARLSAAARLAHAAPRLLDARARDQLDAMLVREAALLVSAERASLRHVDEERRTYSRPCMHGVPEAGAEEWRKLDARVTEATLQRREARITTTLHEEGARLEDPVAYRSFASLPVVHEDRLLAVLNVYDKLPDPALGAHAFSEFDRELLASLAATAARLLAAPTAAPEIPSGVGRARAGEVTAQTDSPLRERTPESPPKQATAGAPAATVATVAVSRSSATLELDSVRLREELRREIARAERHQRELGVSLLHVKGLRELGDAEQLRLLETISQLVHEYVRAGDLVGWYGPDRLMIVSPEADAGAGELEQRLRELLGEELSTAEAHIEVRVGSSSFPDDGDNASTLLQVAAARLH
ncbi:MAG: GAF domain-containing protein [Candidatus Latescibacterota bacterium]|nr:MAG: GAF domain-containing protein [Candidatus Latescibacterota bacterium]